MTYEVTLKRVTIVDDTDDYVFTKKDAINKAIDELTEVWDSIATNDEIFEITVEEYTEGTKKDSNKNKNLNIVELDTVDEANGVDLSVYRWSERMSAKTGRYVFVRRQIRRSTGDIGK